LIFGKEDLLLERAVHRLRERVADVADLDFNYATFEGETADPDLIIADANTLPFDSERRLIIVRDVDRMRADQRDVLAAYAESPSPTTCLVLVATSVAQSSRLYKAAKAVGVVAEYKAPRWAEYPGWVVDTVASRGRTMPRDGAEALVRAVGRDLRRLELEIDKIIAYAGDRDTLDSSDVDGVVTATAPVSVFDLLDAIGSRNCAGALAALDDVLRAGSEFFPRPGSTSPGIHAMTVRHVRTLLSVHALLDRGADTTSIMRELGLKDWQVRKLMPQARRFESFELTRALRAVAEIEGKLKSGQGEPRIVYEMWLIGVCQRAE